MLHFRLAVMILAFSCAVSTSRAQAPDTASHKERTFTMDTVNVTGLRGSKSFGEDSIKIVAELQQMMKDDQKYRSNKRRFSANMAAQRAIDSANTLRMVEIIRTYGFPSNTRFNQSEGLVLPHIILVHAPEYFFDTLRPLLEAERQAGRVTPNEYAHLHWHLDGRKGHPAMQGGTTKYKRGGKKMIHRTTPRQRGKEVF